MAKCPTKAAGNDFCVARKHAATCNDKLNSREGAAEILGIDRSRLARIELGSVTAYPEEVLLMADAYNAPELLNYYCTGECPIGCQCQKRLEMNEADRVTIKIIAALREGKDIEKMLLTIMEDGEIQSHEYPVLQVIISNLDKLSNATAELKVWAAKNQIGGT